MKFSTSISSVLGLCLAVAPLSAQSIGASVLQGVTGSSESSLLSKATEGESGARQLVVKVDNRIVSAVTGALAERIDQVLIDLNPPIFGGNLYGKGLAGTLGVPAISAFGLYAPGQSISLFAENSSGIDTFGYLYAGYSSAQIQMDFGGTLLVNPNLTKMRVPMAPGTARIPFTIPREASSQGNSIHFQVLVFDAGATGGVAMTKGLQLYL